MMKSILLVLSATMMPLVMADENSYDNDTTIPWDLYSREIVSDADACWLQTKIRGVGRPITSCPEGLDQSGLLCYPPCEEGWKGVGPVCWKDGKGRGRGFGRPLGCTRGTEYQGGLCYKLCPAGYDGHGPVCVETCPPSKPFKCGMICTASTDECREQKIQLSMGGFSFLYGLVAMIGSGLVIAGTSGAAAVIGAFGFVAGSAELASGSLDLAGVMTSYPFCYAHGNNTATDVLNSFKDRYERLLNATCAKVNSTQS